MRRKQDPIFKPIDFIKNFIGVAEEDKKVIFCKYEENKIMYKDLFERSKVYMKCIGSNIIAGEDKYISVEDEALFLQKLARESSLKYAYYTLYKIVSYIEHFHDERYIFGLL